MSYELQTVVEKIEHGREEDATNLQKLQKKVNRIKKRYAERMEAMETEYSETIEQMQDRFMNNID